MPGTVPYLTPAHECRDPETCPTCAGHRVNMKRTLRRLDAISCAHPDVDTDSAGTYCLTCGRPA